MADYKIESFELLQEKINEEIEILESIYTDDNIILGKANEAQVADADASTQESGDTGEVADEDIN
jgi:hypothetical protein